MDYFNEMDGALTEDEKAALLAGVESTYDDCRDQALNAAEIDALLNGVGVYELHKQERAKNKEDAKDALKFFFGGNNKVEQETNNQAIKVEACMGVDGKPGAGQSPYRNDGSTINTLSETQKKIETFFDNFKEFLIEKNKRYGDSALSPMKTFSKLDAGSSILVRLDDKLSRIKNSKEPRKNDYFDLLGYIALYCVSQGWLDPKEFLD